MSVRGTPVLGASLCQGHPPDLPTTWAQALSQETVIARAGVHSPLSPLPGPLLSSLWVRSSPAAAWWQNNGFARVHAKALPRRGSRSTQFLEVTFRSCWRGKALRKHPCLPSCQAFVPPPPSHTLLTWPAVRTIWTTLPTPPCQRAWLPAGRRGGSWGCPGC